MSEPARPTLYLVDGTSQLFRAYYAIRGLSNAQGLPTNAVYGFTTMLRKLLKDEKPTHIAVAFDLAGPTFRHDRYESYKANREPAPDDLNRQVPYTKQVCEALGIPIVELPGFEADDVIATYCRLAQESGWDAVVVASDKDLLQLVGDGVTVLNPIKYTKLDAAGVKEAFGVPPERVRDVLGLMGDSIDNIPGVPGVGEKTAIAMVSTYGDLDAVIARARRFVRAYDLRDRLLEAMAGLDHDGVLGEEEASSVCEIAAELADALGELCVCELDPDICARVQEVHATLTGAGLSGLAARAGEPCRAVVRGFRDLRRALTGLDRASNKRIWYAVVAHADAALLSRELATLDRAVPVTALPEALAMREVDRARVRELFERLEFRTLAQEYARTADEEAAVEEPAPVTPRTEARVARSRADLEDLAQRIRATGEAGIAVETARGSMPGPRHARLLTLGVAPAIGEAWLVPLVAAGGVGEGVSAADLRDVLGDLLADASIGKTGWHLKDVMHVLARAGLHGGGWRMDVGLAAFLLDPDRLDVRFDRLAEEILGIAPRPEASAPGQRQLSFEAAPVAESAAGEVAEIGLRLARALAPRLREDGVEDVHREIDGPLLEVLARMEERGIRVEPEVLRGMSARLEEELAAARRQIHELAGLEFNVDSPKQLREVLFDRLGLKPRRKTAKSGVDSTDAATLEDMADEHEIASRILEYRELSKLKGTYVDALPQLVDPATGRVHTSYHPTGAATGRLSSSDPNLQNIPSRTETGRGIRAAFVAEPGWVLVASDYSQVELRVLAHMCEDPELVEAFRSGEDIHRRTAARVFGVEVEMVTALMRQRAKVVNFGVLYGMSETRLAREQGLSRAEARSFIHAYFERFGAVRAYIDRVRGEAMRDGMVRTLFGRLRRFPQLHRRAGRAVQEAALRAAVNATIQGTAADLMKIAMLRAERAIAAARLDARMLLQVHDELLFEVREADVERSLPILREAMEGAHALAVPLLVDQKVGRTWLDVT